MSGAWPQTRRAAPDQTAARALQAIPPATGTLIGHLTGRVIWDSPKPSALNRPQSATPQSAPRVGDYAFHLLLGLGFGDVAPR
jgi:hypothetical protein